MPDSPIKCLQSINEAGMDVTVECTECGHKVRRNPLELYGKLYNKWLRTLSAQGKQLRCSVCGHKGAVISAVERASAL